MCAMADGDDRDGAGALPTGDGATAGGMSARTAWARNLAAPLRDFLSTETAGAVALLGATIGALLWANSPWSSSYESVWGTVLSIRLGDTGIAMDLRGWINEGLMTLFFLVVGLEARREFDLGQLRERSRVAIPVVGALGGMALPVAIFLVLNAGGPGAHGWAAAMSTDTAFALALLGIVAPGGARLRVQMLTLAIFDDLVALIVIAVVYTERVSARPLLVALALFGVMVAVVHYVPPSAIRVRRPLFYALLAAIWTALHASGIDPIISGLAAGLLVSAYQPAREDLEDVVERIRLFREQPTPELARVAQRRVASAISPNERVQYGLHPWTSFVVAPLFALANAGIHVDTSLLSAAVTSPVTLGIFFGYLVGKPVGITAATWIASRMRRAPPIVSGPVTFGGGVVGAVGFTVSLLISSIAFSGARLAEAKIGVLAAATVAALASWGVFRAIRHLPAQMRARQLSITAEDLVDLYDDVDPERDHVRGADDAPVTLVEYGDYQCPYCGQAELVIRALLVSFGDDLRYVWRHLPLNDVHPNAQMAAEAAEAAAAQGRFWDMHDRLLDRQDELDPDALRRHAAAIGLDLERFAEDLRRRVHAERVADDVRSADASGVAGTPSFFVNGRRYQGAYDVDTLTEVVRAARRRAVAVSVGRAAA
jgi:Na+/H+ antiporter NhaA